MHNPILRANTADSTLRLYSGHTSTSSRNWSPFISSRRSHGRLCSMRTRATDQEEAETLMKEDIERLKARGQQRVQPFSKQGRPNSSQKSPVSGPKELLDKVLIADFFFVCIALAWLAAGVAEKGILNSSKLLGVWFPLWPALFQPAIGVLMLGALTSGGLAWLGSREK